MDAGNWMGENERNGLAAAAADMSSGTAADSAAPQEAAAEETIEELERKIAELPVGYISRKMIHGKLRFYRQWTENGKIKSQYIKDGQLEPLEEQIALRRELQKKLKEKKKG